MWTHDPPPPLLLFSPGLLGFDDRVPLAALCKYLEESAGSLQVGAECWQQVYGEASHLLRFLLVQVAELLLPIALCLGEELKNKTGRTFRYCSSVSYTRTLMHVHTERHTHSHTHLRARTHTHNNKKHNNKTNKQNSQTNCINEPSWLLLFSIKNVLQAKSTLFSMSQAL